MQLHFNMGLTGAPAAEIAAARDTAMNPAALDAFAMAVIVAGEPQALQNAGARYFPAVIPSAARDLGTR